MSVVALLAVIALLATASAVVRPTEGHCTDYCIISIHDPRCVPSCGGEYEPCCEMQSKAGCASSYSCSSCCSWVGGVTINWMAHAAGNETVLIAGAGFKTSSTVRLTRPDAATVTVKPWHVSDSALSFVLPASVSHSAWNVSVDGSNAMWLNAPEVWWWQGDLGAAASVGGHLRVFGRGMTTNSPHGAPMTKPMLRLRVAGSQAWQTPVAASAASVWDVSFPITGRLPAGLYEAELQGGGDAAAAGWVPFVSFTSPDAPRDRAVEIRPDGGSSRFGARVFNVGQFCRIGVDCGVVGTNSSWAILAALEAARRAGNGTVLLPRGQWYLNHTAGDLQIPPNVLLRGEATDLTAVYFPEQQKGEAPSPAYLHTGGATGTAGGTFAWAVEDLTIYISHFYEGVIHCGLGVDGFSVRRVRIRANAFAMLGAPAGSPSRGRSANYTQIEIGAVVSFAGCVNFVVEDNDIFGTWEIFMTGGKNATGDAPDSSGGIIRRNTIWNGGGVTDFDTVRRVVFEENSATGIALASFGNNIANYNYMQGYTHHVYYSHNSIRHVWGADREVMTVSRLGLP